MEDVRTTIVMPDGRNVELTATEGFYDGKAETLRLLKSVSSSARPSTRSRCKDALANVRAGTVVSDNPVEVKMLQGTISANRIEVAESGAIIRFEGGVTLVIDRDELPTHVKNVTGAVR